MTAYQQMIEETMELTVYECAFALSGPKDPYAMHQKLWSLIGGKHPDRPYIYRADPLPGGSSSEWVVQVRTQKILPTAEGLLLQPKSYQLGQGKSYRFSLRCAPQVRNGDRVIATPRDGDAAEWLANKGQRAGFSLDDVSLAISQPLVFYGKKNRRITINDTLIEGQLTITNEQDFASIFAGGFGRNRGFGFGMFQLKQ